MSNKRTREFYQPIVLNTDKSLIDLTVIDDHDEITKRTKYIKSQLDNMNEAQLTRFEFFIRSHLSRSKIKFILQESVGYQNAHRISDEMSIVVGGLTKLFIGEIMEESITVMKESLEDTASAAVTPNSDSITCEHIQEAYRRMQLNGKIHKFADDSYLFSDKHIHNINNTFEELIDINHIHEHLIDNTKVDHIIANKDICDNDK